MSGDDSDDGMTSVMVTAVALCSADGRDVSDDELEALTSSLTLHQAEAVKRRIDTLSTTMRKKKGANKMHVKDIFPTPDNSSPVCVSHFPHSASQLCFTAAWPLS